MSVDGGVGCIAGGACATAASIRVGQTDSRRALDLVFVAEGFRADELPQFREHVRAMLETMSRDSDSLVGRAEPNVNAYRVELQSDTHELSNVDARDTALGGCLRADSLDADGMPWLTTREPKLAARLVSSLVPQADATIVVLNTHQGRANSDHEGLVFLNLGDDGTTLSHELGHALIGLGDEYSDTSLDFDGGLGSFPFKYPGPADARAEPNLTTDPAGSKWRDVVASVVEGGGRYKTGVFHPTHRCRMNRTNDAFCPVCAAEAAAYVLPFSGANDGPPRCFVESTASLDPFNAPLAFLQLPCQDGNGFRAMTVWLDGVQRWDLAPFLSAPWIDPTRKRRSWTADVTIGFEPAAAGTVPLEAGPHLLEIVAEDALGLQATFRHAFTAGR